MRPGVERWILAGVLALVAPSMAYPQAGGFQDYFVLGDDEHIWDFMDRISQMEGAGGGFPAPARLNSVVSLATTVDNQIVTYDHWENGFEADINAPVQATTLILGDGNAANGRACDFTNDVRVVCATGTEDLLFPGTPLVFASNGGVAPGCTRSLATPAIASLFCSVPVNPRNSADVRFDGGDRVFTSGSAITVAHVYDPGDPRIGGATELIARSLVASALSFTVPVGENLFALPNNTSMRVAALDLVAFDDNTQVTVTSPGSGSRSFTLNRGQHWSSCATWNAAFVCQTGAISGNPPFAGTNPGPAGLALTINSGTRISTTGPLNGLIVTGGPAAYADYQYALLPDILH
jgi:hypothetical protein